ncbi:MAG: rhomboid family intramembrane serine protease [Halorhodospira halophila]|uniref:rhomboid family intramembrane serine protease n=1 Tax=Halorhodospira TaxID=85108 RepID=UPI001912772D|nr:MULTISPECIES: rhomboid family intramembrane serine protease [Halorhodospira]MBK5937099.1 rhomboid family intramembrane serine protease [Halorhodospira halophila]MBK5944330.1 rhomboid family intramembrane serine protease [Halorhodospira halophila]MCC3750121.1 rhomboid family intramembrane serine protease [Halorhodospira halophila]MCG5527549.1 rhomboid family intramembrane serine protease [Halorhodospira halophila]MCG5533494.1 rhomboid family intramembrane serine protease [Halorhodospira sp. 
MDNAGPPTLSNFPPVIGFLLTANILIFLLQIVIGPQLLITVFGLWPLTGGLDLPPTMGPLPDFQIWQLLTYGFLHGGLLHLFVNLFAMWILGVHLEYAWGSRTFALYFFICVIGAGLVQLFVATQAAADGQIYPTVGASGGVFGILLAFGMMFPNYRLMLLIPPIPIKAKYFVIGYGAFELFAGITGTVAGIAHFAHLGGMVVGFLLIQYWRGKLPIKPRYQRFHW